MLLVSKRKGLDNYKYLVRQLRMLNIYLHFIIDPWVINIGTGLLVLWAKDNKSPSSRSHEGVERNATRGFYLIKQRGIDVSTLYLLLKPFD